MVLPAVFTRCSWYLPGMNLDYASTLDNRYNLLIDVCPVSTVYQRLLYPTNSVRSNRDVLLRSWGCHLLPELSGD